MRLSAKKKIIIGVILLVLCLVGFGAKKVYDLLNDPVWNYDIASMQLGSKIVRFEKCGEHAFCAISDFRHERKFMIYYEDGKITSIIKLMPPLQKHRVEWEMKLSPEQHVVSKHILIYNNQMDPILCQYDVNGNLMQAEDKQRCGQENPNQNPEVLKILRFFNSEEAKRILHDDH